MGRERGIDTAQWHERKSGEAKGYLDNLAGSFARGSIYLSIRQDGRGEKSDLLCYLEQIMAILMLFLSFFF